MTRPMGPKRGRGRAAFIDSVLEAVDVFHAEVMQYLKASSAAPPPVRPESEATGEQPVAPALVSTALSSQDGSEVVPDPTNATKTPAEPAGDEAASDGPVRS